jgi:hypothetical protein
MLLDKITLADSCCEGERNAPNKKVRKGSKPLPKEFVADIQGNSTGSIL